MEVTTSARPAREPREHGGGLGEGGLEIAVCAAARICASMVPRSSLERSPSSSMASTKKRRPVLVGKAPAEVMRREDQPRMLQDRP